MSRGSMVVCLVAKGGAVLGAGYGRASTYTPFPPGKDAASLPICFGSEGTDQGPIIVWISTRGVGFSGWDGWSDRAPRLCSNVPRQWANRNQYFHWLPSDAGGYGCCRVRRVISPYLQQLNQADLAVVRSLYRMARQHGFGTLPRSLGKPWQVQQGKWCNQDCSPTFDFMEFGGRTVYDGNGNAEGQACGDITPRGQYGPIQDARWTNRFADIFDMVASLTPYCSIMSNYWGGGS